MIKIGILGDIGSGKSYVAKQFGFPVFDADVEVAKIYKKNRTCFNRLKNKLPKYISSFPLKKSKLGKHTTTNTTIYHIPSGGDLIDSPGIREFQLDDFDAKQILNGFREFKALIGKCRFRNCQHINEPDCAIKVALDAGDIYPSRYENYLNLLPE